MVTEFLNVLFLSAFMFVGCIVAGYIPLSFSLSQRKIQLFTIFGAGLLVGTALAVIIPEGVEAIYGHEDHHHDHLEDSHELHKRSEKVEENIAPTPFKVVEGEKHEHHEHSNNHKVVGISLLLGFVSMLLVDQCSGSHGHSHSPDIKLDNLTQSKVGTARQGQSSGKGMTATVGLVVHAAADGIALGAAASTSRSDLQILVFLAIMLHKAPAAFGLVSFLMHDGLEPRKIKRHLLAFSSAAPALAIITFFSLRQYSGIMSSSVNGTGIAMLFSAGTFLYVATVHVLPEISHQTTTGSHTSGLSRHEVVLLILGCLLPLVLNIGHHH